MASRSGMAPVHHLSWLVAGIIGMTLLPAWGWAQAASTARADLPRLLTAMGNGEVRVRPDLAEVRIGVETEAPTATQARQENAARAQRVVSALRALQLPENAIQTSTFEITPVRRYDEQPQRGEPPIVGYRVANIVTVRVSNLDLVPRVIDESVRAGANRVDSVSFMLRDDVAPSRAALRAAVAEARSNAQEMARELGLRLVRVYNVQQGGAGVIQPPVMYRSAAADVAVQTPVMPGEVTVSASATVTYIIQ